MRREVPLAITFLVGFAVILNFYIPHPPFDRIVDWATSIVLVIYAFAIVMGAMNLNKINIEKIQRKRPGWGYSVVLVIAFFGMVLAGIGHPLWEKIATAFGGKLPVEALDMGSPYMWLFYNIQYHLSQSMFSMLAFFVASASYRAFRARTPEATLLLLAAFLVMLGRVPIGDQIPIWVIYILLALVAGYVAFLITKNKLTFSTGMLIGIAVLVVFVLLFWLLYKHQVTKMNQIADWIMDWPNTAGQRAIMLGIGLGYIATSLRIILGIERSFVGGE